MPNVAPLLAAPWPVIVHFFTVVPAFFLGAWLLAVSRKGAPAHRALGKVYLGLMAITAFTAIFIDAFSTLSVPVGPLRIGLIHLFIPLTFWSVYRTRKALSAGDIEAHRASMRGLYLGGLIIAGLLTFAPGRIMYRMFFG
jgi:uncharacterized membrane protein